MLFVAAAGVGVWYAYRRSREQGGPGGTGVGPAAPKLVVLVVFDQMRGDYLERWGDHFGPDGFDRVKKNGVWYSNVHLPYACSSTGPGHASLVTGATPSLHGIAENEWYDRTAAKRVYCVEPSRPYERVPPLPKDKAGGTATRGTESGFSPERLLAPEGNPPTVGDCLHAATGGKGRVFSLSIKDRTAVLMGGRKPEACYCFDTRDGKFHTGAFYRDRPHPWVEEFNAAGPVNSWFDKKWERFRADLDYTALAGPDDAPGEGFGSNGQGRVFPHPFAGKLTSPGDKYYAALECSPFGNELLLELAKKAVAAEGLGTGEAPDLLCLSFSSNDLIGHQWGPDSWEVLDITLRSDRLVADLLKFLDEKVPNHYLLVISADHGICPIPEQGKIAGARRVSITELLTPLAAALDETFGKDSAGPTRWFEGTDDAERDKLWPWLYLNRRAIEARGIPFEAVSEYVAQWIAGRPYCELAFTRKQVETGNFPLWSIGDRLRKAYHPDRCGDVVAVPKPGVLVTGYANGTSHGSPHPYDTHVPVLAFGAGVPALGKRTEPKSSLIVAPILARGLRIDPPVWAAEKLPSELNEVAR